jgi:hypothetical protein
MNSATEKCDATTAAQPSLWARFKAAFGRWCHGRFVPLPVGRIEWFIMRLLFAAVVFHTFLDWKPFTYSSTPHPSGLARIFDLSFIGEFSTGKDAAYRGLLWFVGATLAVYLTGFRVALLISLPVLVLLSTLVRSYSNSQGFTHHGFQIVTLTLLGQMLVVWYVSVWEWRRGRKCPFAHGLNIRSYFVYYSQAVVLSVYVISAITKTIKTRGLWPINSRYLAIEPVKTHRTAYYKDLDPALAELPGISTWLLQHPLLTTLMFSSGFFLELFALAGLRDRTWAFIVGLSLIIMHQMIFLIMGLTFHYNEALCAIFLLNIPFWLVWSARKGRSGRNHETLKGTA